MFSRRNLALAKFKIGEGEIIEEFQGGNSTVLRCVSEDSTEFGLKIYLGSASRQRQMIDRETQAIQFLTSAGFLNIPKNFTPDFELKTAKFDWFHGVSSQNDVDSLNELTSMAKKLYRATSSKTIFPSAIDAVFELSDIAFQIRHRLDKIKQLSKSVDTRYAIENIESRLRYLDSKMTPSSQFGVITLSLSDMGTHNLIRSNPVSHQFIDFEFFGVDSLTKLIADFWLHPRNFFSDLETFSFQESLITLTGWNAEEMRLTLPFFALKWATIAYMRDLQKSGVDSPDSMVTKSRESKGDGYLDYFDSIVNLDRESKFSTFNNFLVENGHGVE